MAFKLPMQNIFSVTAAFIALTLVFGLPNTVSAETASKASQCRDFGAYEDSEGIWQNCDAADTNYSTDSYEQEQSSDQYDSTDDKHDSVYEPESNDAYDSEYEPQSDSGYEPSDNINYQPEYNDSEAVFEPGIIEEY